MPNPLYVMPVIFLDQPDLNVVVIPIPYEHITNVLNDIDFERIAPIDVFSEIDNPLLSNYQGATLYFSHDLPDYFVVSEDRKVQMQWQEDRQYWTALSLTNRGVKGPPERDKDEYKNVRDAVGDGLLTVSGISTVKSMDRGGEKSIGELYGLTENDPWENEQVTESRNISSKIREKNLRDGLLTGPVKGGIYVRNVNLKADGSIDVLAVKMNKDEITEQEQEKIDLLEFVKTLTTNEMEVLGRAMIFGLPDNSQEYYIDKIKELRTNREKEEALKKASNSTP